MKRNASIWIASLTLTAIVLAVALLAMPQKRVQADMLNVQPGYSLMTVGGLGADQELVIVDKNSHKVLVYQLNGNKLELVGGTDFQQLFGATPAPVAPVPAH